MLKNFVQMWNMFELNFYNQSTKRYLHLWKMKYISILSSHFQVCSLLKVKILETWSAQYSMKYYYWNPQTMLCFHNWHAIHRRHPTDLLSNPHLQGVEGFGKRRRIIHDADRYYAVSWNDQIDMWKLTEAKKRVTSSIDLYISKPSIT